MIPVPCFNTVTCTWLNVKEEGYALHGFLVYLEGDREFPAYMISDGLSDLDIWSGSDCAIFMVHSPSEVWVTYTRATKHVWWRLYGGGEEEHAEIQTLIDPYRDEPVVAMGDKLLTLKEIIEPPMTRHVYDREMANVLHRFGLKPTDSPCLIFFKDLADEEVWVKDLSSLVNKPQDVLRAGLKEWFGSQAFEDLKL